MPHDGEKTPKISSFIKFSPQSQLWLAVLGRCASAAGRHHDLPCKRTRPHQTPLDLPAKHRRTTRTPWRIASMPHAVAVPNQQRPVVSAAQLHRVLPGRQPSKRHLTARCNHRPRHDGRGRGIALRRKLVASYRHDGRGRGRRGCDPAQWRQVNHLVAFLTITSRRDCHHRPRSFADK